MTRKCNRPISTPILTDLGAYANHIRRQQADYFRDGRVDLRVFRDGGGVHAIRAYRILHFSFRA